MLLKYLLITKILRFWRNTSVPSMTSGQITSLGSQTLGYEWNYEQAAYKNILSSRQDHHVKHYRQWINAQTFFVQACEVVPWFLAPVPYSGHGDSTVNTMVAPLRLIRICSRQLSIFLQIWVYSRQPYNAILLLQHNPQILLRRLQLSRHHQTGHPFRKISHYHYWFCY